MAIFNSYVKLPDGIWMLRQANVNYCQLARGLIFNKSFSFFSMDFTIRGKPWIQEMYGYADMPEKLCRIHQNLHLDQVYPT
jgi:hypothetical protein